MADSRFPLALALAIACVGSARAESYGVDATFTAPPIAADRCHGAAMATAGDATLYTSLSGAEIARVRKDGTLDPSFGNGGVVSISTSTDFGFRFAKAVLPTPDGGVLVIGGDHHAALHDAGELRRNAIERCVFHGDNPSVRGEGTTSPIVNLSFRPECP